MWQADTLSGCGQTDTDIFWTDYCFQERFKKKCNVEGKVFSLLPAMWVALWENAQLACRPQDAGGLLADPLLLWSHSNTSSGKWKYQAFLWSSKTCNDSGVMKTAPSLVLLLSELVSLNVRTLSTVRVTWSTKSITVIILSPPPINVYLWHLQKSYGESFSLKDEAAVWTK